MAGGPWEGKISTVGVGKDTRLAPPYEPLRSVRLPDGAGIPELGIGPGVLACIHSVHEREDGTLGILAEISSPDLPVACLFLHLEVLQDGSLRLAGYSKPGG